MQHGSSMEVLVLLLVCAPSILLTLVFRLCSKQTRKIISPWFAWKLGPAVVMPVLQTGSCRTEMKEIHCSALLLVKVKVLTIRGFFHQKRGKCCILICNGIKCYCLSCSMVKTMSK